MFSRRLWQTPKWTGAEPKRIDIFRAESRKQISSKRLSDAQIKGRTGMIQPWCGPDRRQRASCLASQPAADAAFTWASMTSPNRALLTGLLEHDHGLRRGVNGQGSGPLHRAVGPAGDAVASSRVGEPQTLRRINHHRFYG